jgi:hypothetical protein
VLPCLHEARRQRTVEVDHRQYPSRSNDWDHQFGAAGGIAGDVPREGVDVRHQLCALARRGGPAHALPICNTDAGGAALERAQDQLAIDRAVKAGPIQIG